MSDEIIEELWRIKDDIAREYNYDLDLIVANLRNKKNLENQKTVNLRSIKESIETRMSKIEDTPVNA